jgi:hypothetical protein
MIENPPLLSGGFFNSGQAQIAANRFVLAALRPNQQV